MRLFFSIGLLFIGWALKAQEVPPATEQKLEAASESTEAEIEDDSYLQNLEYHKNHPLAINTASKEDLQTFLFLTDLQIDNLLQYRRLLGAFINIYELQAVPTWDIITIKRLLPYITIASNDITWRSLGKRFSDGSHTFMLRESKVLESSKGYNKTLPTHYLGSNDHLFFRYKYQYGNTLEYGLVAEKDAGEPLFKHPTNAGFDFYSAHLFARNVGRIKGLALGDFTVNMGQGLIQWQTLAFGKSADITAIKRQSAILQPYSSSGEVLFHRGIGATWGRKNIEVTAFASFKKVSGNIISDTLGRQDAFSGFQLSGLHRTASEIKDKNSVAQTVFGGNITYQRTNFRMGLNAVTYSFSKYLQKRNEPYNRFAISGTQWANASLDYSYTYKNMHFFGEAAVDKNRNSAFLNGLLISAAPNADIAILYRNISPAYQSLYSNAFTENTAPTNEKGVYIGASIRPITKWKIDAYADYFRFPWLKYRVDAPSEGGDYLVQATYRPNKKWEAYIRYKKGSKPLNESDSAIVNVVVAKEKESWRANLSYTIHPKLSLRARMEVVHFDKKEKDAEKGFLNFIQLDYQPYIKLFTNIRLQYCNTGGYNSRIYAYESDVLYSYSIPPFFDAGWRYYLNFNYHLSKKLSAWVRWAQTIYVNKETIGSGLDQINGNKRSEIKLQLRYRIEP